MSYRFPACVQPVLKGKTRVIEPRSTYEINGTIRQSAPSHRGDRVDHVPKVLFTVLQVRIEAGILPRARGLRSQAVPRSDPPPRASPPGLLCLPIEEVHQLRLFVAVEPLAG